MAFGLTPENPQDLVLFLVLILTFFFMIVILKSREKIKRRISVILSLTATCTAALAAMNSFFEYTLDGSHVLTHVAFSAILLLSARLLVPEKIPTFFNLFALLELDIFDRFQYRFAEALVSFAGIIKGVQTGDLRLNMIFLVIGFIFCLLLPFLLVFMYP